MKISFFDGNIKNVTPTAEMEIGDFLNRIKYGEYKTKADQINAEKDKKKRSLLKAAILPYVTITGTYSKRNAKGLKNHSGLWAVDIDGITTAKQLDKIRKTLSEDPYTFAVGKSVSGEGLFIIVRITTKPENQKEHEDFLSQYYYETYGMEVDENSMGISRARFASYDPDIFINPQKSKIAGRKKQKKTKNKPLAWKATTSQIDRIISEIHNNHPFFADSYDDFLICALSLANEYGEGGRSYFHAVAMGSSKYEEKAADSKFNNALKTNRGDVKIGSFFRLCQAAGIELHTREEREAYSIAINAKKNKSDVKGAIQTAQAMGIEPEVSEEIAEMVFKSNDIDLSDPDATVIQKTLAFVRENTDTIFNTVTKAIEHRDTGEKLDDRFISDLYIKAKMQIGDSVKKGDIQDIIEGVASEEINPFSTWVEDHAHLPEKPEIIDEMINLLKLKDTRTRSFIRSWLIGLPASVNRETVRLVLCFIGGQETGKTEFFRKLFPKSLKKYMAESDLLHGNAADRDILMASMLMILDDEMGGKSKKDAQSFKAIASKEVLNFRKAYGRYNEYRHRLALLCGTTNDAQLISDATGNTRILPVELSDAYDFEAFNALDKDQLFIEIFRAYDRGETWKLSAEQKQLLESHSSEYSVIDIELEMLDKFFGQPSQTTHTTHLTATEIKDYIEQKTSQKLQINKLGIHLRKKFERVSKRIDGNPKKVFAVTELNIYSHKMAKVDDNERVIKKAPF